MNHHFEVPCEDDERETLIEAATLLEDKLDQVTHLKGENKVLMVALNLCYDYVQLKRDTLQYTDHMEKQLEQLMQHAIEQQDTQA
jgi:cell division protein ZapA